MNCPACGQKQFPEGKFIQTPLIKVRQDIHIIFWFPISFQLCALWCMACGFLATRKEYQA